MTGLGGRSRPLVDYGFALLLVAVAAILTLLAAPLVHTTPALLFFAAVALSAWYGGFGPGVVASLLSMILVRYLVPDSGNAFIDQVDIARLATSLIIAVVASILHRQHAHTLDALRRSRDQLDVYLRDMANGITVQDRTGKVIYANHEAARVMGFVSGEALTRATSEEILGRFDIFDEFGEPFPLGSLPGRLALLGMKYPEAIVRYRFKPEGPKEHWAFVKARPIFDERGEPQASISLFLDITELKQTQHALSEQREQFRVTLRSIGDAVIAADRQGRVTFINPVACAMTGWTEDEALGHPIAELVHLIHQDTRETVAPPVERVLKGDETIPLADHLALLSKDGAEYAIAVTATSILDAREQPIGTVLVIRDITERRRSEATLRARVRQQEVVAALGLRALSDTDLTMLMQEAARQLAETLDSEYAKVLELLPGGKELRLRAGVGWREGLVGTATVDTGLDSQAGYTLISNEPVVVEDLPTESRFNGPPLLREHNVISGMSVIIRGETGAWGVLGVHTTRKRVFTKDDVNFLQSVANLIALAVERDRVQRAERDERIYAEALRDTAEALSSTLDLGKVLDRILENVGKVVPHDAADVMLIEGGAAQVMRYRGYEEFNLAGTILDLRLPIDALPTLSEMVSTQKPLIVPDSNTYTGWTKIPGMEWLCSYMGVPLVIQGTVVGFLNVSSVTPGFFTPEQANRLQAFASQATAAIRNARLYDEVRKAAGDVPSKTPEA